MPSSLTWYLANTQGTFKKLWCPLQDTLPTGWRPAEVVRGRWSWVPAAGSVPSVASGERGPGSSRALSRHQQQETGPETGLETRLWHRPKVCPRLDTSTTTTASLSKAELDHGEFGQGHQPASSLRKPCSCCSLTVHRRPMTLNVPVLAVLLADSFALKLGSKRRSYDR